MSRLVQAVRKEEASPCLSVYVIFERTPFLDNFLPEIGKESRVDVSFLLTVPSLTAHESTTTNTGIMPKKKTIKTRKDAKSRVAHQALGQARGHILKPPKARFLPSDREFGTALTNVSPSPKL